MKAVKINGLNLKQAIEEFGSLQKAVDSLKCEKAIIEEGRRKVKPKGNLPSLRTLLWTC